MTHLVGLAPPQRQAEAARRLLEWRREADRRAGPLAAPAVWDLANDPRIQSMIAVLDPGGELQADLDRVCAEAVASQAGRSLVRGGRPLADRARLIGPRSST